MAKLKQEEDEELREGERMAEAASMQVVAGQQAAESAVDRAMEAAKPFLEQVKEIIHDCKEGAIEGNGKSIAEKVCAGATNAIGGEGARLIGEGASDIANGKVAEGIEKCARGVAELAQKYMELRSGSESGTFFKNLAGDLAKKEAEQWLRD